MRFLFVHQNGPGQYLHVVRHLARDPSHELVFITEANDRIIPGVRHITYRLGRKHRADLHPHLRELELATHRAEKVAGLARTLRGLGFRPDIIVGHHGWGEMLHLADLWPDVPMLGYFEFYYHTRGFDVNFDPEFPMAVDFEPGVRAMNAINHAALALGQHGQTPTQFQRSAYPDWARRQITLLPEGVDLDICRPNPALRKLPLVIDGMTILPSDRLITYVARNLEPYRGYHVMMRALPRLLSARADVKVVMLGGGDVSYGARRAGESWRDHFLRRMRGKYDESRVRLPGQCPYDTHLALLQRSDVHVYLTYPFVASWSLREALACGCAVVGADVEPVREFIADDRTGVLTPALDPAALAENILSLLEDAPRAARLRRTARRYAERHLDAARHVDQFTDLVTKLTSASL